MTLGIGTILVGLALLAVVVVLVITPLFEPKAPLARPLSRREALEAERQAAVRSIRDLDFDYRTHKLNEDDYNVLRLAQVQRGAAALRQLDEIDQAAAVAPDPSVGHEADRDIDAEIEDTIAAYRRAPSPKPEARSRSVVTCPSCGKPVRPDDQFCAQCGQPLKPAA